ncbi:unnamed protein product [Paramecium pentaurelia]|uniref:Ubiquitin-like protease family profile domain-containing protein n=1 Tax=Paramecium pentaurelia TaxID=43138 RepID=A0A8S1Y4K9_9CILI|nr:unnamed protein product [Paramecium pentaurelia]
MSEQQKQPNIINYFQQYKQGIQNAFKILEEVDFELPEEDVKQKVQKQIEEQKQPIEPKFISQADIKRALENFDKLICQLQLVTPLYSDPKYLNFESNDRTKRQTQMKHQQMWDQIKLQQKERFARFQDQEILERILELDSQLKEDYEYNFQFSSGTQKKTIQIKYHDVLKLNPPNYLNDGIINFYLKFIEFELLDESLRSKTYIFNTYFVEKLCPFDKLQTIQQNDNHRINELFKQSYEHIKRWVKEDLTEKEYLLFPINLPEHWSLLIAHKQSKSFQDSVIIYLDSFGIIDQKLVTIIKMYLHKMQCDKIQSDVNYNDSPIKQIPAYQLLVPRQVNYVDCGAFLLEYAESFLSNPNYLLSDFESQEGIYKLKLFPRTLVNKKRLLIKQLLIELVELGKEKALINYKQRRSEIIESCYTNEDEYDKIDQDLFKEFLNQKNSINVNSEQQRSMLLDFYMNPQQNYYEQ